VHPRAQLAAEAAEAAARQGRFWEYHDLLLERQKALRPSDLTSYAEELGLDGVRFAEDLRRHAGAGRIAEDVDGADLSSVCPERRPSSSTASVITAPTTSRRCPGSSGAGKRALMA